MERVLPPESGLRQWVLTFPIAEGLVCVLSVLEPCRMFSLVWNGRSPYGQSTRRKCLHFYYYFLDRDLGLIHFKLQSWFPFQIQIYVNGHEWLARQLDRHDIKHMKLDNAFVRLSDVERSQELADSFERVDWIHVLGRHALRVNPLLRQGEVLHPMPYYWVTAQSEYSTDILFRKRADLEELMPRLCQYSALDFSASDVMSFLGRKRTGRFFARNEEATNEESTLFRARAAECRRDPRPLLRSGFHAPDDRAALLEARLARHEDLISVRLRA